MDRREVLKLAAATALVGVPTVAVAAPRKREPWEDGAAVLVTFCVTRMHPLKMAEEVQRLTDEALVDNPGWAFKADPNIAWPAEECTDWWSELDFEIHDLEEGQAEDTYNADGFATLHALAYPAPPPNVSSWKTNTRQCVNKIQPRGDETGDLLRSLLRGTYALWKQNAPQRAIVSATVTHFVYRQDPTAPRFETRLERARRA